MEWIKFTEESPPSNGTEIIIAVRKKIKKMVFGYMMFVIIMGVI